MYRHELILLWHSQVWTVNDFSRMFAFYLSLRNVIEIGHSKVLTYNMSSILCAEFVLAQRYIPVPPNFCPRRSSNCGLLSPQKFISRTISIQMSFALVGKGTGLNGGVSRTSSHPKARDNLTSVPTEAAFKARQIKDRIWDRDCTLSMSTISQSR